MLRNKFSVKFSAAHYTVLGCLCVLSLLIPLAPAHAEFWNLKLSSVILLGMSWAIYYLCIYSYGMYATAATSVLVYVAQLNHFTDLGIIVEAWSVVRDLANMVFIVVLLAIAFGTLFRLEAYSWKKLLPKMIISAILINYSRAICGVLVDASQVIMLTFVAAIKDAAAPGFVDAFHVDKILDFGNAQTPTDAAGNTTSDTARFVSLLTAGYMLSTLFTVQLVYIVVLIGRLVMIWFLTVLSPIRFATSILPATEKYASQWDEMFGRYVTIGPMIMFFLWLSLFIAARSADSGGLGTVSASETLKSQSASVAILTGTGSSLDTSMVAGFVIATMMLAAGMKMAIDNSSELGEFTGKAKDLGNWVTRVAPAAVAGFVGGAAAGSIADRVYKSSGVDLNLKRGLERVQHKRHEIQTQRVQEGYAKAMTGAAQGKILPSLLGAQDFAYEQYIPKIFGGQQGLIGGPKALLTRRMPLVGGEAIYQRSLKSSQAADSALSAATAKRNKARADVVNGDEAKGIKGSTYREKQARELERITNQEKDVNSINASGVDLNMKNGNTRALLEKMKADKTAEQVTAYKDGKTEDAARLSTEISSLTSALKSKEDKVTLEMTGGLKTDLGAAKSARLAALAKEKKAEADKQTFDGKKEMVTAEDFTNFMKAKTAPQDRAMKAATAARTAAYAKTSKYGPVFDYERVTAMEKILAEERKKYGRDDNEDTLKARLKDIIHEKKGTELLGLMTHMAEVGHDNEMAEVFASEAHGSGIRPGDNNVESLQKMKDWIVKETKVDEQMAMGAMNEISLAAKRNNHQFLAEAVTTKHGRYEWRSESERNLRNKMESDKKSNEVLVKGNRLAYGGYKDGVWRPDAGMMEFLIEKLPASKDLAYKGNMNASAGQYFFANEVQEKQLKDMVDRIHTDPEKRAQAYETMALWKQTVRKDAGTVDLDTIITQNEADLKESEARIIAAGKKAA